MEMYDQDAHPEVMTRVLLICVYNRSSAIITHDQLYQFFSLHGVVFKILIFVKAKVWKAFIQLDSVQSAKNALQHLNNTIVLEDGSRMVIFPSKLQEVNFQNDNNGGVDYEELRRKSQTLQLETNINVNNHQNIPYFFPWHQISSYDPTFSKSQTFTTVDSQKKSMFEDQNGICEQEDWFSPPKNRKRQSTWNTYYDVDAQFQEIAMESQEYRSLRNRPKSKTIVPYNPKQDQYILDNYPSKVLFVRSIPQYHIISSIYNIFSTFGNITKIVNIKFKQSMLIEFQHISDATEAKDFLNLVKNSFKIFFSHYETLQGRQLNQNQQEKEYKTSSSKKQYFNPPSQTLHICYLNPSGEQQFIDLCKNYGTVKQLKWVTHNNNKKMLLLKMGCIEEAMKVLGFLQGRKIGSKYVRISFTRSKLGE